MGTERTHSVVLSIVALVAIVSIVLIYFHSYNVSYLGYAMRGAPRVQPAPQQPPQEVGGRGESGVEYEHIESGSRRTWYAPVEGGPPVTTPPMETIHVSGGPQDSRRVPSDYVHIEEGPQASYYIDLEWVHEKDGTGKTWYHPQYVFTEHINTPGPAFTSFVPPYWVIQHSDDTSLEVVAEHVERGPEKTANKPATGFAHDDVTNYVRIEEANP
ncbi:hypothetical protein J4457_07085 [Candidatus Woesearchaeota archaeon]|nr:hypothetical protein [Candidatus Woesearchaeota archaeon]